MICMCVFFPYVFLVRNYCSETLCNLCKSYAFTRRVARGVTRDMKYIDLKTASRKLTEPVLMSVVEHDCGINLDPISDSRQTRC